jgi:hypothetical protein
MDQAENDSWNQWATTVCNQRIAAAFAEFREFEHDVIAQVIAEERKTYRAEIRRQIGDALRELRDELVEYGRRGDETVRQLRQEIAVARGYDKDKVLDLPNPLRKRGNGQAA